MFLKIGLPVAAAATASVLFVGIFLGLYTIQPIGALPDGATVVIWRAQGQPFFDSPDAVCARIQGGVSLLCRALAMGRMPHDRILIRLPYSDVAYLMSTGGVRFDR